MSPVSTNTYVNMILVISVLAWCCVGSPTAASQCFRTGTVLEQEGKSKSQNIPTSFYQLSEVSFIYANYFLSLIEYLYAWSYLFLMKNTLMPVFIICLISCQMFIQPYGDIIATKEK